MRSHTMRMTRLWKALGEPDVKDSELIKLAAARIRKLERACKALYDGECHCHEDGVQKPCTGCVLKDALYPER